MPGHPINDFFSHHFHPRREILELTVSSFLRSLATAMFILFSSVYLYQSGFEVWQIILAHALAYGVRIFWLPLNGKFVAKYGYELSMAMSIPFVLLNYVMLAIAPAWHPGIYVAAVLFQLYLSFYWTGFHGDMAAYSKKKERGKEISLLAILSLTAGFIGPILGGLLIEKTSFIVLLVIVGLVHAASMIPLFTTKEKVQAHSYPYLVSLKLLKKKAMRRFAIGLLGWGEELLFVFLWPIFVFIIVQDYITFGWIAGFATLLTGAVTILAGMLVDKKKKGKKSRKALRRFSPVIISGIWALRSFASTASHIFFLDTGAKAARSMLGVAYSARVYDRADKTDRIGVVILWQQAVALGKMIAGLAAVLILLVYGGNLVAAFFPAALLSLLLILL